MELGMVSELIRPTTNIFISEKRGGRKQTGARSLIMINVTL